MKFENSDEKAYKYNSHKYLNIIIEVIKKVPIHLKYYEILPDQ